MRQAKPTSVVFDNVQNLKCDITEARPCYKIKMIFLVVKKWYTVLSCTFMEMEVHSSQIFKLKVELDVK